VKEFFLNRLTFDKVTAQSLVASFLEHSVDFTATVAAAGVGLLLQGSVSIIGVTVSVVVGCKFAGLKFTML